MALNPIYNLPEVRFVGGSTQEFRFRLLTQAHTDYNANGATVAFSVINYTNKNGVPLLVKPASLRIGSTGVVNIAEVTLLPTDTVGMYGRYVYQLSIKDSAGETEIPGQGLLDITRNIHQSFIT